MNLSIFTQVFFMENIVDYIIVGDGYAGLFFAHQLIKNNKKFVLYTEGKKSASHFSAGVINPVVLKRFSAFWLADEQISFLQTSMDEIAQYLPSNYFIHEPIHRIFHDEKERGIWQKKIISNNLTSYLSSKFKKLNVVENPYETGVVHRAGRIDVQNFFSDFLQYLNLKNVLKVENFDYSQLNLDTNLYKDVKFEYIIFCEGTGVLNNPYFNFIPIIPNKGHFLKVKLSVPLIDEVIIKKKHFLFQVDSDTYYYGGTYDPVGLGSVIDPAAEKQLTDGLKEFYFHEFKVLEINFGYRPTLEDRRPVVGAHKGHPNLFILNGLGARGILNGNYFANHLYNHIENGLEILPEVQLGRFSNDVDV